jgi:hypothetical protein
VVICGLPGKKFGFLEQSETTPYQCRLSFEVPAKRFRGKQFNSFLCSVMPFDAARRPNAVRVADGATCQGKLRPLLVVTATCDAGPLASRNPLTSRLAVRHLARGESRYLNPQTRLRCKPAKLTVKNLIRYACPPAR